MLLNISKYKLFIISILCLMAFLNPSAHLKAQSKPEKAKYVILITIDGMRSKMVTDVDMPSPTLKYIASNGVFVEKMISTAPSSTYTAHTTLATGARPINHGIFYNNPFEYTNIRTGNTNWYADSIRTQTIWGAAKAAGLTTCSLFWPVSTNSKEIDYNVPEYWSLDKGVGDQLQFIKDYCSPPGIFEEIEQNATGKLLTKTFDPSARNREARTGYIASYILETYRPKLTTIHLISTDYYQHSTGTASNDTKRAVSAVDYSIGQIIETLERTKMIDSTAIIVCGDHGFIDTDKVISPNVWLKQAGLLSVEEGKWKAYFHGSGATMFLYLKDSKDKKTLETVRTKLSSLPKDTRKLFRIVEKDELARLGCDPKVAFAVEPIYGVGVATNMDGADITHKLGGKHGYLTPYDPTTLIAYGVGVPKGKQIYTINIQDVAPFVMELLGVEFKAKDGKLIPELLE